MALAAHNRVVERHVAGARGAVVKFTGDGALATFDGPARAINCACAIRDAVEDLGLSIRAGLHTGEVEMADGDVHGIAVHIAARIMGLAGPGGGARVRGDPAAGAWVANHVRRQRPSRTEGCARPVACTRGARHPRLTARSAPLEHGWAMLEEGGDAPGGVAALKHSLVLVEQHLGGGVTGCTLGSAGGPQRCRDQPRLSVERRRERLGSSSGLSGWPSDISEAAVFWSAQVRRQKPAGNRLAAVGFVSKFDAGQTREPVGHIAIEARGSDVVENPVLRNHPT